MTYPNTLLGYFKNSLSKQCSSIKYFNRDFLGRYIAAYNESHKSGVADYSRIYDTDFYKKNGSAYCVFLEIYADYRKKMDRAAAILRG